MSRRRKTENVVEEQTVNESQKNSTEDELLRERTEHPPISIDQKLILTNLMYTTILFAMIFMIVGITHSNRGYNFPGKLYNGMRIAVFESGALAYRYLAPAFNPILSGITGRGWPIGKNPTFIEALLYGSVIMISSFVACFLIRIKLLLSESQYRN
jgi:hypothetical protein